MSNTTIEQRIGNIVRHSRLRQGLTQEQLAELIESNVAYISQLESGKRNPTIKTLSRIAQACQVELFQMLQIDHKDETMIELMALLMSRSAFDRQKILNIAREIFRAQ
ncbi:helix-turn-helix domain-containing protein [Paenibacillus sp. GCM10027626]|uniref:helix-turn-helix domain-containing protein n=1 Tax=Paenibacillus sp. GCM10027626 TaxID=3273411 RepID=UPI003638E4A7